ncbi:efflux RND transporter permease subunit [uncultured Methylobacterium sp.]|jgi:HAE1 family hydrophobic/amphiphilic exporter-1|uniref:efflux RND transporter permease subunit n=1 Tax=uncultured Methylobacterium sp. TaxID=157278 RepID=UPI002622B442|nr:efflux RND transporter permease subunit [uncultured Methylobacterium sp.]
MSGVSSWSIRHPIPPLVLFVLLTVAGLVAFGRLPINANPNVDIPTVIVTVTQAGAAASEIETQVTRKIEGQIAAVANVKHVTSTIQTGVSTTTVEFQLGTPIDRAVTDVKDAVDRTRSDLPRTIDEPVVGRLDAEGAAILTYAVAAPTMAPQDLSWFIDDTLSRELRAIRGVGQILRKGGVDREIRIDLDPDRLDALGLTASEVSLQLRTTNLDVAAGRTEAGGREHAIRALGGVVTAEALARTEIVTPRAGSVRLGRIGTVSDGAGEARQIARLDGEPVIAFEVLRAKGSSEVAVAEAVEARLAEVTARNPGIRLTKIATTVSDTLDSYHASVEELLIGAALASVVVLVFLRSWRATLIAAIAMPLSMVPTFAAMLAFGFSLNVISLLGLTLVVGILVDDAIVEIENIIRHGNMGKRPYRAALDASDEIGLAVVATTMAIVVVFLPVSAMGGVAGQYFRQFGVTVAVAVFCSLVVARLLTPLIAAYFLEPQAEHHDEGEILRLYRRLLGWSLDHRWISLGVAGAIFAGSIVLAGFIPAGFLPRSDKAQTTLSLELPPGVTLARAERTANALTETLRAHPAVRSVFVEFGAPPAGLTVNAAGSLTQGSATVVLKPRVERGRNPQGGTPSLQDFHTAVRPLLASIPDLRIAFPNEQRARDVSVLFVGADTEALTRAADALVAQMSELPMLASVRSTTPLPRAEVQIRPKTDEMARLGISVETLATALRVATQGDLDQSLAKFSAGSRQVPIRVRLKDTARDDLDVLRALKVASSSGAPVPLRLVADIEIGSGEGSIDRFDRERRVAVEADLVGGATLGQALAAVQALPGYTNLPTGVRIPLYGDAESMAETFSEFALAMGAGLLLIYVVLVLLFRDVLQPITIMTALPLSLSGAFGALLLAGMALDVLSLIGLLMLMGIVTKNSILIVDYAIEEIRTGVDRRKSLLDAGVKRARPIIMTTVAMIAGMMVPALGFGAGSELRAPMAVVVIGGLLTSTVLSLLFVPVAFTFMDDLGVVLGRSLSRLTTLQPGDRETLEGGVGPS